MRALLAHVDVIRLDHFRAFAAAWHVPAGAPTAETGEWAPGPGAEFFRAVQSELGALPFIAEDLGVITPDVSALRDQFDIPGTRVLQFAFDGNSENLHLPDNYSANTVVYTGTHDNATTREWFEAFAGSRAATSLELAEAAGRRDSRCRTGVDPPGLVVPGRARHDSAAGSAQSGPRGPHERAGLRGRKLALAGNPRHVMLPGTFNGWGSLRLPLTVAGSSLPWVRS